jgi:hypothetical protein
MLNELITLDSLINEHSGITGHMNSICKLTEDWKEMEIMAQTSNLDHQQISDLNQKSSNLRITMSYLEDGLMNHWVHEDVVFPGLIGGPLMKALKKEHEEILKQMREINYILSKSSPQDFLSGYSYLNLIISNLCRIIQEHETKEDTILVLLKNYYI